MDKQDNFLVNKFLKQISKIIDHKLEKLTTVESAIVDQVNIDGSVNLHIPPDSTIFTGVQNQSIYQNLKVGDCVKVLKQNNKASNMWIIGGHNLKRNDIKIGKDIIDVIYPIGFVYISINNINPSTLFGGTWEQIKDTFLLAAGDTYAAGATGGAATHTLTEAQLPAIYGEFATAVVGEHANKGVKGHAYGTNFGTFTSGGIQGTTVANQTQYGYGYSFGYGQPHNNMPPYLAVYVWKRTA
nr:MAG TPA: baseplate protein [Bacteriophage sp.]